MRIRFKYRWEASGFRSRGICLGQDEMNHVLINDLWEQARFRSRLLKMTLHLLERPICVGNGAIKFPEA